MCVVLPKEIKHSISRCVRWCARIDKRQDPSGLLNPMTDFGAGPSSEKSKRVGDARARAHSRAPTPPAAARHPRTGKDLPSGTHA